MSSKLLRRVIVLHGKQLYPVAKGTLVPFNDKLIEQALFGAKVQADLIASTDGLKELIKDLSATAKVNGYVTMLGGRRVPIRHAHATLNSQLQGMGAEAMKHYLVFYHREAKRRGIIHGAHFKQQACIYDEVDLIVHPDYVDDIVDILQSTYAKVSNHLGMKCPYMGEVLIGGRSLDSKGSVRDNSWYGCH